MVEIDAAGLPSVFGNVLPLHAFVPPRSVSSVALCCVRARLAASLSLFNGVPRNRCFFLFPKKKEKKEKHGRTNENVHDRTPTTDEVIFSIRPSPEVADRCPASLLMLGRMLVRVFLAFQELENAVSPENNEVQPWF